MKHLLILLLLIGGPVFAQEYDQHLAVQQAVAPGNVSDQKAVASIVASHPIGRGAAVSYLAGRSVTLQPGFWAPAGAILTAKIEPVVAAGLEIDGRGLSARAYPNPFVERTTVEYIAPRGGRMSHTLTDVKGRVLRHFEGPAEQAAGRHETWIDGGNLPPGVYLYQLRVGAESRTLRLIKK
ncbi:T9SS type A sorting domain-containing protein [Larkinella terrae]|uniref:T9SS type A sorting domain-containing protein n=1 Tax=Larkinella terrae TaxID=2025311 RepID=A0A7K0ERA0_9BACT|nr:T9SS type A sorting domain-containing protein [Larkinella terrae]MRS64081.1 T9SS type A sorting domain-containing protein [Larkinella terrae]